MPTPSPAVSLQPAEHDTPSGRGGCPPDETLSTSNTVHASNAARSIASIASIAAAHHVDPPPNALAPQSPPPPPPLDFGLDAHTKQASTLIDTPGRDIPTPMTATDDGAEDQRVSQPSPLSATVPTPVAPMASQLSSPFPPHRFLPHSTSSLLRPGSRFRGSQTSDRQQYEVEVEVKHVDMRESFMCGYLRIKGLTEDHPSLTTYFESEIIGTKFSFITQHPEWGSNEKVDRQHWARFPAHKPLSKSSSRPELVAKDLMQKEYLFMRWKEYFLVPDHRVRTINGASFEGFYYICFNQVSGSVEGIYFHAKSEKFQKLQLEHVQDYGCQSAIEFR